jgi:hypothetical protein
VGRKGEAHRADYCARFLALANSTTSGLGHSRHSGDALGASGLPNERTISVPVVTSHSGQNLTYALQRERGWQRDNTGPYPHRGKVLKIHA